MNRILVASSILALTLLAYAGTALSHHPARVESCRLQTFAGQLERIEWHNPHVLLFIKTDSGETQTLGWLDPHRLALAGIRQDTLHEGDYLVVEGGILPKDIAHDPILASSIRRPADGWEWMQTPEGC